MRSACRDGGACLNPGWLSALIRGRIPPRTVLLLSCLFALILGAWLTPHGMSLYHLNRGGAALNDVLSAIAPFATACAHPRPDDRALQRKLAEAIEHLETARRATPGYDHTYLQLGKAHCLAGRHTDAVEALDTYTTHRPDNPLGHLELAFATLGGCQDPDRTAVDRILTEIRVCQTEETADQVLAEWRAAGVSGQDFLEAGRQALRSDRYEEALAWFSYSLALDPDRGYAWALIGDAIAAHDQGTDSKENAREAYRKAYALGSPQSVLPLQSMYFEEGNYEDSAALLSEALASFPSAPQREAWWEAWGTSLQNLAQPEQALDVYRRGLREFPEDPALHVGLGLSLYEFGQGAEAALQEIDRAIALDPDSGEGHFARAQILTKEGRYAEAERWYRQALARNQNSPWWFLHRGNAARAAGDLELAVQVYEQSLERFPQFAETYYDLAWAHRLAEREGAAVEAIKRALALSEPQPKWWYHVRAGRIYEWTGDEDQALTHYQEALKINPENEVALEAVERLESP